MNFFFIYCNFCTSRAIENHGTKKYYLEKCGKIFCETCALSKICSKCGQNSPKRLIDATISAQVGPLFDDPMKRMKSFVSNTEYQIKRLITQIQMINTEKSQYKINCQNMMTKMKSLYKKNQELTQNIQKKNEIIKKLENQLANCKKPLTYEQPFQIQSDDTSFQLNITNGNMNSVNLSFENRLNASTSDRKRNHLKSQQYPYSTFERARIRSSTPLSNVNIDPSSIFESTGHIAPSIISRRSKMTRFEQQEEHLYG